ncbi:hypothetical protein EXIGLDRAFT_722308 [Exidia glandulosa HHB12029]|uniref:BTB domain-containing protein n=1 Tax=Exidia glandulosa HHB12029 TaxID=1314781 RepID=A0A165N5S2_EXIGL|nr:hypothetical protein EXIGLDRAFT_722308 [Exidia glandulosa HHB12029]
MSAAQSLRSVGRRPGSPSETPPTTASSTLPRMFARNQNQSAAAAGPSTLPALSTSPPSWSGGFLAHAGSSSSHNVGHDEDQQDDENGNGQQSTPNTAGLVGGSVRAVSNASSSNNSTGAPPGRALSQTSEDTQDYQLEGASPIDVHPTFSPNAAFPGTVKIVVEATTFWAHREILHFASPFFEAALSGNWSETGAGNRTSISSVITISQPPSVPGDQGPGGASVGTPRSSTFSASVRQTVIPAPASDASGSVASLPLSGSGEGRTSGEGSSAGGPGTGMEKRAKLSNISDDSSPDTDTDLDLFSVSDAEAPDHDSSDEERRKRKRQEEQRTKSLKRLGGAGKKRTPPPLRTSGLGFGGPRASHRVAQAVVVLKEEKAATFHDFLKFIYPQLDCTIAWNNVEGLMNIAQKLLVPSLQHACLNFLLTHAAGKPIKAMRIAELFEEEELYREASRFVLDNPGGWSDEELKTLSADTLLKLEKRRNWFLERLLKLGLTNISAQYQCCPTCPDSSVCARILEEKWKLGYSASFRFGPAQPSMVYRYLRLLEGISPPLALTQLACHNHAKSWIATLFDRMFSLDTTAPMGPRVPGAALGPRRHFLYCSLKGEPPRRKTVAVGI